MSSTKHASAESSSSSSGRTTTTSSSSSVPLNEKIISMIGKALKIFNQVYEPFTKQLLKHLYGDQYLARLRQLLPQPLTTTTSAHTTTTDPAVDPLSSFDTQTILHLLTRAWPDIQKIPNNPFPGHTFRNYLFELKQVRNKWAHQYDFSLRDAYRAFDTLERVISLPMLQADTQANEIRKMYEYVLLYYANEIKRRQQREQQQTSSSSSSSGNSSITRSSSSASSASNTRSSSDGLSSNSNQYINKQATTLPSHQQQQQHSVTTTATVLQHQHPTPIYQQHQQPQQYYGSNIIYTSGSFNSNNNLDFLDDDTMEIGDDE